MIEEFLGFDVRLNAEEYLSRIWTSDRRSKYLLYPQTSWPLSVDLMVWPSIFKYQSTQVGPMRAGMDGLIDADSINTRHSALVLWPNLEEMNNCLSDKKESKTLSGTKIAISLHVDKEALAKEYWSAVLHPALSMNDLPKNWKLIGYDIADQDMISGMSNCDYKADEVVALRELCKDHLNEYGLFHSFEDALSFRGLTDKRVPNHSPFYIYSLFWEL